VYDPAINRVAEKHTLLVFHLSKADNGSAHLEQSSTHILIFKFRLDKYKIIVIYFVVFRFPNRSRRISTPQLNGLLHLHLVPINLVIS
jgi:hypothetical protein